MKSLRQKIIRYPFTLIVVVVLLALIAPRITGKQVARAESPTTDTASLAINAKNENSGVLPPKSNPFGKSYGEWSAEWWQWAYALPATDDHPLIAGSITEETGDGPFEVDCSLGQDGKVWFLGGTFTLSPDLENPDPDVIAVLGRAARVCTVPTGKALFFPVLNAEADNFGLEGGQEPRAEDELRAEAHFLIDAVDPNDLSATIDGVEIGNLQAYRTDSPLFTQGPLPNPNLPENAPGATSIAVADGYYLMLPPLSAGQHEIDFAGKVVLTDENGEPFFSFRLDISYDLTVKPGRK